MILAFVLSVRVVMGWVSSRGYSIWVSTQLHRPTQPGHPFIGGCNEYWRLQMYCLARNTLVLPGWRVVELCIMANSTRGHKAPKMTGVSSRADELVICLKSLCYFPVRRCMWLLCYAYSTYTRLCRL